MPRPVRYTTDHDVGFCKPKTWECSVNLQVLSRRLYLPAVQAGRSALCCISHTNDRTKNNAWPQHCRVSAVLYTNIMTFT